MSVLPLVDIRNLKVMFDTDEGRRTVVDGVSLQVNHGEVLGILGESGSGKTMTTMALLGLIDGYPGVVDGQILVEAGGEQTDLLFEPREALRGSGTDIEKSLRRWNRATRKTMGSYWGHFVTAIFQHPRASLDPLDTIGRQVDESVRLAHPALSSAETRTKTMEWLNEVQ